MNRTYVLPSLWILICLSSRAAAQEAGNPPPPATDPAQQYLAEGYTLVWSDEFDQAGRPDPAKWTYERGFVRNEELQWYQDDNARCTGGLLVIEGRRERVKNPHYRPSGRDWRSSREYAEYTSSCLITQGLRAWQYGRFEMRARIDTRPGLWPAWWTLGTTGRWPANGEIDIMEYYRGTLLANVAWAQRASGERRGGVRWDDLKLPLGELGSADWPKEFHVWRMDWDEHKIELSVDGRVLNTTDLKETTNPEGTEPRQPFRQPHYMLVNLAIGGSSGGDPARTDFPSRFEVDYIRVYQQQEQPRSPAAADAGAAATSAAAAQYIPDPQPVQTNLLIGAHHCPLWEADKPQMWANVVKHPERTPALGFYAQENPEVADWETKWAVEHGVSFFVYCWYRASQGKPVEMRFGSAIHDALFKARFTDKMKFTIMWENQSRGTSGVADEQDLMQNLLPFWIESYFRHPSYLKVDNKPLLFIYRPEFLIQDLGSIENVARALNRMREACKAAGFDGLYILGEYRGLDANHLGLMKQLGLDYTFAYCWHVQNNPTPQQAIREQLDAIRKTQAMGIIPQVVTVSQGWSGWHDEGSIWKIPPADYETLLQQAKDFVSTLPADQLGSRMLLLDNWNEWGEGHYIAPHREYGFGYLDAVRKVFSQAPAEHTDLIPSDIGLGPYDRAYQSRQAEKKE